MLRTKFFLPEIYTFIADVSGVDIEKLQPDSDLCGDLGIDGDDFFELAEAFAKIFSVDMSTYRWYFHHGEEGGPSIGRLLCKPPDARVRRIPVTPEILQASANAGCWQIAYPEHQLPSRRGDLMIDRLVLGLLAVAGFSSCCGSGLLYEPPGKWRIRPLGRK